MASLPQCAEPPTLFDYDTWCDKDGYHARFRQRLPKSALAYGCRQVLDEPTARELGWEATRNRVRVWVWETR